MRFKWLFLVDLDGTVWDHKDISALDPPFKKVSQESIKDKNNVIVTLNKQVLELIKWALENGALVSTLSWNNPVKAYKALKTFGILELFHYLTIEDTPRKDHMIKKLLRNIEEEHGIEFTPDKIVYIDDRDIHIHDIYKNIGKILFLHYSRDIHTKDEAIERIVEFIKRGET